MRLGTRKYLPLVLCAACLLSSCQTTNTPRPESRPEVPPSGQFEFAPVMAEADIHSPSPRYPNLYAPESFAIWVSDEVLAGKRGNDVAVGAMPNGSMDSDAAAIQRNFLLIECHITSAFPDSSIAYDVVGLRGVDVYLETSDGRKTYPIQRIIGSHADESMVGALTAFSRQNILIFPKHDVMLGSATLDGRTDAVRLVLDGFHSNSYFVWMSSASNSDTPSTEATRREKSGRAAKIGYSRLMNAVKGVRTLVD